MNGTAVSESTCAARDEDRDGGRLSRSSAARGQERRRHKAMAVPGVRQVVRIDDAVAVVADHMGAAKKGLAALDIEWNEGPNATLTHGRDRADLDGGAPDRGRSRGRPATSTRLWRSAAKKIESVYELPYLVARDDGAAELHGARAA